MLEKEDEIVLEIYYIAKVLNIERKKNHNLLLSFQDLVSNFNRISYQSVGMTFSSSNMKSSKRRKPLKTTNAYFY